MPSLPDGAVIGAGGADVSHERIDEKMPMATTQRYALRAVGVETVSDG